MVWIDGIETAALQQCDPSSLYQRWLVQYFPVIIIDLPLPPLLWETVYYPYLEVASRDNPEGDGTPGYSFWWEGEGKAPSFANGCTFADGFWDWQCVWTLKSI